MDTVTKNEGLEEVYNFNSFEVRRSGVTTLNLRGVDV